MVRAKFRCMSILHAWNNQFTVEMQPVVASGENEENRAFWNATPTGEIRLVYGEGTAFMPFVVGDYYYVDMAPDGEDGRADPPWRLYELSQTEHRLGITLSSPWDNAKPLISGSVKMGIDNADAWSHFLGKVGSAWAVIFTRA